MSSKSKSTVLEATPHSKAAPATSKVSRPSSRGVAKSDADSPSPLQNSHRLSVDRSPRSVSSKPTADRRSPKLATPPDKQPARLLKGSELEAQLNAAQKELKKSKEKSVLEEKEKAKVIEELKEAQRLSGEANEKLREALVAQKRAEESSEIEKFRAIEMEQAGIEAAQKKEEEWQKEMEAVRNQHALDVAALLSATQELQRVRQELTMMCDAKNQAVTRADDATKIAEIQARKVETLSSELTCLRALLDSKSQEESRENNNLVAELKAELEALKQELDRAKVFEEKLLEKEASLEELNIELEAVRMAESYAQSLIEEWKTRVEELDLQAEEAKRLERSASESLESVMKQLQRSNEILHDEESKIASLTEKVGLLEMSITRQRGDLEESERSLVVVKKEASDLTKKVESLIYELEAMKEERAQALNNEKLAAASVQTLLEEKNKLISELESCRDEEEKSKKAMESLASALHEVSAEAREVKEKLLSCEAEHEHCETQIEDLRLVLKATNEKYERMLDDSKHEIDILMNSIEQAKRHYQNSEADWKENELCLTNSVQKSREENSAIEGEMSRMVSLLGEAETEASAAKEEGAMLKTALEEAESEVIYLKEVLGEAKAESMRMKESLLDKENELQSVIQENEELQAREAASLRKIEELSKLLADTVAKGHDEGDSELTDSEKDYDMLPKVVEFSEWNGNGEEENREKELRQISEQFVPPETKAGYSIGEPDGNVGRQSEEFKMWESCKIGEKDLSPDEEREEAGQEESFDEDAESKAGDRREGFDQINGLSSAENAENDGGGSSEQQQKKKKPLLRKFGSLLKKKSSGNHK